MTSKLAQEFAARALDAMGDILAADGLVEHTVYMFAEMFEGTELDILDTVRSRYINLADPDTQFPADLVRMAGLFGLGSEPGMAAQVFRERLRLFVHAFLQGAGTPRSILTMAAAELGVLLNGDAHRQSGEWIQPVRRPGSPPDVIRLQENPVYRVEKQPVLAKTGIRWTIDNPGIAGEALVYPQVAIEALVDDVRGPSIIFEDIGLAWLSPDVVLDRGDRLILQAARSGAFSATLIARQRIDDVTAGVELIGRVPDETALDGGIRLIGGNQRSQAEALVRAQGEPRVVRLCARSPGLWGNGLVLKRQTSGRQQRLVVEFDPAYAATEGAATDGISQWTLDVSTDALSTMLGHFRRGEFLLEAEQATLFLPTGRSHWMYLDHLSVSTEDFDLRNLARLLLDYTRYDHAVHHETDTFDVFRLDRDNTRFNDASYTVEEERVRITYSWLEPRPTAIRLEVPDWLDDEPDDQTRARAYQRLADGILRIKPAGVAVSLLRSLPDERVAISEVFPEHITADLTIRTSVHDRPQISADHADRAFVSDRLQVDSGIGDLARVAVTTPLTADVMTEHAMPVTDQPTAQVTEASSLAPRADFHADATALEVLGITDEQRTTAAHDVTVAPAVHAIADFELRTSAAPVDRVAPEAGIEASLASEAHMGAIDSMTEQVAAVAHMLLDPPTDPVTGARVWLVIDHIDIQVASGADTSTETNVVAQESVASGVEPVSTVDVDPQATRSVDFPIESAMDVAEHTTLDVDGPETVTRVESDDSEWETEPP